MNRSIADKGNCGCWQFAVVLSHGILIHCFGGSSGRFRLAFGSSPARKAVKRPGTRARTSLATTIVCGGPLTSVMTPFLGAVPHLLRRRRKSATALILSVFLREDVGGPDRVEVVVEVGGLSRVRYADIVLGLGRIRFVGLNPLSVGPCCALSSSHVCCRANSVSNTGPGSPLQ